MTIVDQGSGRPLVLIPGAQGRWEWMRPTVEALARRCRVITFSLADEPTAGWAFDTREGFWNYVRQVREAMDLAGVGRAAICGVSYGGPIASAFAARHRDRATSLILVSALPPGWRPDARQRFYLRAPRLLMPLFALSSLRMLPEIAAAHPGVRATLAAAARHALNVLRHPLSPSLMARRVRLLAAVDLAPELARLNLRTLVITGEDRLDRVVAPALTREYLRLWPHVASAVLENTGHLGLITHPDEFARIVCEFAAGDEQSGANRPLEGSSMASTDGRARRRG